MPVSAKTSVASPGHSAARTLRPTATATAAHGPASLAARLQRTAGNRATVAWLQATAATAAGAGTTPNALGSRRDRQRLRLAHQVADRLGLPPGSYLVLFDEVARQRTRAARTRGWAERGTAYLDPDHFDPETRDGVALLAHELTHLAQARLPVTRESAGTAEAEAEARAIGRDVAAGGTPRQPRVAYRQAAADTPTTKKTTVTLPPGQDIGFLSNGYIVLRVSWYGKDPKNPDKLAELLRVMKSAQYYWWMTDAQMAFIAANFTLDEKYPTLKDEFAEIYWTPEILGVIGPPPGTDFFFAREAQGAIQVVIRSSAVGKIPDVDPIRLQLPRELYIRLFDALDQYTGVVSAAKDREQFLKAPTEVRLQSAPLTGSLIRFPKDGLDALYQPERYRLFLEKRTPGTDQPKPVKQAPIGGGKTITFDVAVSDPDMAYASKWLETVGGAPSPLGVGGPQIAGKTYYQFEIEMMREIDKSPQHAAIVAKLRTASGPVDWSAMQWAVNQVKVETAANALGVTITATGDRRVFPEPVRGEIVVEGFAYPGRTTRIWFRKSNLQSAFLFEIIHTQWVVEKFNYDGSREKIAGPTFKSEFNARVPNYFEFGFPEIGTYRVNAFVDHNWFFPGWFTEDVEVKSEEDRLKQVKKDAFDGMGDRTVANDTKHFDTTFFNEHFGPDRFSVGKEIRGTLPDDWKRMSDADRLKFIAEDKKNLDALITQYDKPNAPYAHRDLVSYAKNRKQSLAEQETKINDQKNAGFVFFEARGAYLSRTEGVGDSALKLVGMSHGDPDKVVVRIHDFTRLFEPDDYLFEGDGTDFDAAAEEAFIHLCKRYPKGRMSVVFERMNNGNQSYRVMGVEPHTIGWELDTNTAWKTVRSVVWDPAVTIVVNLAGAALMIFLPFTAPIVLPVLAIYNSIETVSKMEELQSSGQLSRKEIAKGVAEIGLNVLPVIAEFKSVAIAAKVASAGTKAVTTADRLVLYGLEGVTIGGMLVLMTAEGVEQCKKLQEQDVSEVARLMAELDAIRKQNPNSPEIARLEAAIRKASDQAVHRAQDTFEGMVKNLAILLVPTAAMAKISKTLVGKNVATLIEEGKFIHQEGVAPHYDPVDGMMKGDKAKVTPEVIEGLKSQFALDQGVKQTQLEKLAGTDKVEITYDKNAKSVSVAKDTASGKTTITAPEGMPFEKVVQEAWNGHFSKQQGAPKDMPTVAAPKTEATTKGKVIASKPGVQVGRGIENLTEAKGLLRRIAEGDKTAFGALGAEAPGRGFDPQKVEWGLGQTPDGKYVIIRGQEEFIDWSKTPGVTPVGHSHPMAQSRMLKGSKITFADLVKGAGENAANADKVMPSPVDIKMMVENGLTKHTVQTPYVSEGAGVIGNPVAGVAGSKIDIEIVAPGRDGAWKGMADVPVYRAKLRARTEAGVIWEGDVWATHHPESGSQLMFAEPSPDVMSKNVPGTPTAPLAGAQFSGSHNFKAANDVQARALADWQKLENSPTKYTGKFKASWEDWLYRYEKEGLLYDAEGTRRWKSADGQPREVEMFAGDAKAADVVKRLTTDAAGPTGSTSTFKPFFETLKRRGLIKDDAALEALIEKDVGFKDRSVDFVRHKLKERFKPQLMDQASPQRWDAAKLQEMQTKYPELPWTKEPGRAKETAGHREISDVVKSLDSADKGPMLEQWLAENVFPDAKGQIAANKGEVDTQLKPGESLGDNRKIDLLDGETAVESKAVNDKLSAGEASLDSTRKPTSQLLDYLRMISAEVKLTVKGQIVQLKKLKYVFTTTTGAQKNLEIIKEVLNQPQFKGKVTFDVYDPTGVRMTIKDPSDLAKPEFAWLKK